MGRILSGLCLPLEHLCPPDLPYTVIGVAKKIAPVYNMEGQLLKLVAPQPSLLLFPLVLSPSSASPS